MTEQLRKSFYKAIEEQENDKVILVRAPKALVRKAVKEVMKTHSKTIKELSDR